MFQTHKYRPSSSRKSRIKGECEHGFWKPLRFRWGQYFDAIDSFQKKYKEPGQRYGPLGPVGRDVFEVLVKRTGRTGVLELSLDTIAKLAGCCRSAVVHALKLLRAHGFVRWINRYVVASEDGLAPGIWGPQVWQTSNAYCVNLPPKAVPLASPARPQTPVDEAARKADMVRQLRDYACDENGISDALERLRRSVEDRHRPPD